MTIELDELCSFNLGLFVCSLASSIVGFHVNPAPVRRMLPVPQVRRVRRPIVAQLIWANVLQMMHINKHREFDISVPCL